MDRFGPDVVRLGIGLCRIGLMDRFSDPLRELALYRFHSVGISLLHGGVGP